MSSYCRRAPLFLAGTTLIFWAFAAPALNPEQQLNQYRTKVWTEREGLPHSTVQAISQTPDKYLWVGTRDGLARFDGVTFKVFGTENEQGLACSDIRSLLTTRDGTLWIGTFNGGLSCLTNGRIARVSLNGLPSNGVVELFEDSQSRLWLGTWNGLACLSNGTLRVYGRDQGLHGKRIWSIAEASQGQLWVATSRGLHRSSNSGRVFERQPAPDCGPPKAVRVAGSDTMWIGTFGQGIASWREGAWAPVRAINGLADDRVNALLEDRQGSIWVGTCAGLTRIHHDEISSLKRNDGLPHEYIECVFEDKEGSLWAGTRGGGLIQLEESNFSTFTSLHGLASDLAKCVMEASDGSIWVGTEGGGVSRIKDKAIQTFTTRSGLPSNFIYALAEGPDGAIWMGSAHPAALIKYEKGGMTTYFGRHGFPVEQQVRSILVDPDGVVWAGGEEGGLALFADGKFTVYGAAQGLGSELIRVIFRDSSNRLWVATGTGLCWIENGEIRPCPAQESMPDRTVYSMCEGSTGTIWLGTQHGLARYRNGNFEGIKLPDALDRDILCQVLSDQSGNLWLSSSKGVFSVSASALSDYDCGTAKVLPIIPYGVADGMKSTHCEGGSQPAGCLDRSGRLWFPTAAGVAMVNPGLLLRTTSPGDVRIEQIAAGDNTINVDPTHTNTRFPPSVRHLQFTYTVLGQTSPERVEFRYKIRGYEHEWIQAHTRRVARYAALPPGEYVFEVGARLPGGEWHRPTAEFAFTLEPHFYQTTWFLLICVTAASLGVVFLHRWKMQQARAAFALVLAERNRIARELHDTLAQGFAGTAFQLQVVSGNLKKAPHLAIKHLDIAIRMVRHSMAEARRSVLNMRSADLQDIGLSDALQAAARNLTAGRNLQIQLANRGSERPIPSEVEGELLRIGQEAITNAVEHAQAQNLRMGLEFLPDKLTLEIQDDGKGFDSRLSTHPGHFGLLGMRERTEKIGGKLDIESWPGLGTRVRVQVPLERAREEL